MAVYTEVSRAELSGLLEHYPLGSLRRYSGIRSGIENTNYFVTTSAGDYVLTLFECTPARDLPFFLELMAHLAARGIASAAPVRRHDGRWLSRLAGRPAALVRRLPGKSVGRPTPADAAALGETMARMHLAVVDFAPVRADDRGADWRAAVAARIRPRLDDADLRTLDTALESIPLESDDGLPGGVIHADLFRDNVLFTGSRLSGVIDFYYARNGAFVYDLAVAAADWCFAPQGRFDLATARALLGAYAAVRRPLGAERAAWAGAIRAAGRRFWLSRLNDLHFPRAGALTLTKDPETFKPIMLAGCNTVESLDAAWDGI